MFLTNTVVFGAQGQRIDQQFLCRETLKAIAGLPAEYADPHLDPRLHTEPFGMVWAATIKDLPISEIGRLLNLSSPGTSPDFFTLAPEMAERFPNVQERLAKLLTVLNSKRDGKEGVESQMLFYGKWLLQSHLSVAQEKGADLGSVVVLDPIPSTVVVNSTGELWLWDSNGHVSSDVWVLNKRTGKKFILKVPKDKLPWRDSGASQATPSSMRRFAFSKDGKTIYSTDNYIDSTDDFAVWGWDAESGQFLYEFSPVDDGNFRASAGKPDGSPLILAALEDGFLLLAGDFRMRVVPKQKDGKWKFEKIYGVQSAASGGLFNQVSVDQTTQWRVFQNNFGRWLEEIDLSTGAVRSTMAFPVGVQELPLRMERVGNEIAMVTESSILFLQQTGGVLSLQKTSSLEPFGIGPENVYKDWRRTDRPYSNYLRPEFVTTSPDGKYFIFTTATTTDRFVVDIARQELRQINDEIYAGSFGHTRGAFMSFYQDKEGNGWLVSRSRAIIQERLSDLTSENPAPTVRPLILKSLDRYSNYEFLNPAIEKTEVEQFLKTARFGTQKDVDGMLSFLSQTSPRLKLLIDKVRANGIPIGVGENSRAQFSGPRDYFSGKPRSARILQVQYGARHGIFELIHELTHAVRLQNEGIEDLKDLTPEEARIRLTDYILFIEAKAKAEEIRFYNLLKKMNVDLKGTPHIPPPTHLIESFDAEGVNGIVRYFKEHIDAPEMAELQRHITTQLRMFMSERFPELLD